MGIWKRLACLALCGVLCLGLLAACAQEADGSTLSVCVGAAPVSLDPIYAEETGDQTILVHLYENLMRVTADASGAAVVTSGMAKSVDQEESFDGTVTCTFRLRSARWSDGTVVKAGDFVYAWRRLADPASGSPYAELLSVVAGYDEARTAGDMSLLQVTARNDTTLVVVLKGRYDWFLTEVCTSPATMPLRQDVLQELKDLAEERSQRPGGEDLRWWSDPTALVCNGPYQAGSYEAGSLLTLRANEEYTGTQAGPEMLTFHFANSAEEARSLYDHGTVDALFPLTEERLTELAADETWDSIPEMGTYAVLFNCGQEMLGDPAVRQAVNQVIDRDALTAAAGVSARIAGGLVPPGVPEGEDGDFRTVGGDLLAGGPETYEERCVQAMDLLNEAGYGSGADLGEMTYLYEDTGTNGETAQLVCQMWQQALGLNVTPVGVTRRELWLALRTGEYDLAGADLTAVGNDAECFLMDWTSESTNNVVRYANSAYDTLMAIIAMAADGAARMGCLHDAEDLLISDCVMAPLYTRGTAWELRETLTGACRDARGWFSFAGVVTKPT